MFLFIEQDVIFFCHQKDFQDTQKPMSGCQSGVIVCGVLGSWDTHLCVLILEVTESVLLYLMSHFT